MHHETRLAVSAYRWPVGSIGGECLTTIGIDIQGSGTAEGFETIEIQFHANGLAAFTFDERDGLLRAFEPLVESGGKAVTIRHEGAHAGIVRAVEPQDPHAVGV